MKPGSGSSDPSSGETLTDDPPLLEGFLVAIRDLRDTLEDALASKLDASTIDTVVELVLLRSFSVTEELLRELFYACMLGDDSIPGSGGVVSVSERAHADLLLLSTGDREVAYLSWLPASRALDAARRYLKPSNPFERLRYRDVELTTLRELTIVRNAVAHPDSDAMRKFQELAESRGYPHSRPARYLLSQRGGELEIRLLLARLERIGRGLTEMDEETAASLLESERPFQSGSAAPIGSFACTRCGSEIKLEIPAKLPVCPTCPAPVKCETCGHERKASSTWRRVLPAMPAR